MKKIMIFLITGILILLLPLSAYARAEDAKIAFEELYNDWEMNGYPDYVGHVIYDSDQDQYVIGLVNPSQAEIDELESGLVNNPGVVLGEATYSYKELLNLQEEIWEENSHLEGIYGVGVGWTTIDGEVTGFGESGHEMRIVVMVDESIYLEISESLSQEYGDRVFVEVGTQPVLDTREVSDNIEESNNLSIYLIIFTLLIAGVIVINRNRFVLVKETTSGNVVTGSRPLGKSQVVSAVKKSGIKPRDKLYEDVLDKLKE